MPTIIDSLFLELGIDTSKFSKDQQQALAKIKQFETQSKRSAKKSADSVKTVGAAFRDIADDSRIGASTKRLDAFSTKLRALGQAGRVGGGVTGGLGMMVEGLGALLSPATLALAAVGLLGKGMWDFNEKMTATNATIFRQAQLSGMNAKNLWAWGQAAKTVGASPQSITGGIANLQTAVMGMGIGAANATPQLVALARLGGVGWNFKTGVDVKQLFARVHQLAKKRGYRNLGALRALTAPLMDSAMWSLATDPAFNPDRLQAAIKSQTPASFRAMLENSLTSQKLLGKKDIQEALMSERAYGAIQNPMQTLVGLFTDVLAGVNGLLRWTIKIATDIGELLGFFTGTSKATSGAQALVGGVSVGGKLPAGFNARQRLAMRALMGRGMSINAAAAIVGNATQESSLNPVATSDKGAHIGLFQLDKARQAAFAKAFGYRIGSSKIPLRQQFLDELMFAQLELGTSQKLAGRKFAAAHGLAAKTRAFERYDERPGDHSFGRRLLFSQEALEAALASHRAMASVGARAGVIHNNVRSHTVIYGGIAVNANANNAEGVAQGIRGALRKHPLLDPKAVTSITLLNTGAPR